MAIGRFSRVMYVVRLLVLGRLLLYDPYNNTMVQWGISATMVLLVHALVAGPGLSLAAGYQRGPGAGSVGGELQNH